MPLAEVLADHPAKETFDLAELHRAATAAMECSLICAACADSDLGREGHDMQACIRMCMDCSDLCSTTARLLARPTPRGSAWMKTVAACAAVCAECAAECEQHDHVCCRECAAACRACEQACQALLAVSQS